MMVKSKRYTIKCMYIYIERDQHTRTARINTHTLPITLNSRLIRRDKPSLKLKASLLFLGIGNLVSLLIC